MKTVVITIILTIIPLINAFCGDFPRIPDGEVIRYRTIKGKKNGETEYSSQAAYRIEDEKGEYFLIKSSSPNVLTETLVTAGDFTPLSMKRQYFGTRSDIQSTTTISRLPELADNEIALIDTADLAIALRAYPFENPEDMNLLFLGQGAEEMENMGFRIIYRGEEKVEIDGKGFESWKLELKTDFQGAMAIFSSMVPKTYFWFSREPSRHLLKMTGSRGPGSGNEITVEMISYTK